MNFSRLYKVLLEYPIWSGDLDYRKYGVSELTKANTKKIDFGKKIDTIKLKNLEVVVFKKEYGDRDEEYRFVVGDSTVAIYFGKTFNNKEGIKTEYMESKKGIIPNESFMGEIYIQFLLKRYKYIMSDTLMTSFGFKFWYNNFDNFDNRGLRVYAYNQADKVTYRIHNKEELKKYYGKGSESKDYSDYKFIVSTVKL